MEGLLCSNNDTLPSCSSFSCDEGLQTNYLEDDFSLPSAAESEEEPVNELTLPSATDTLSSDQIYLSDSADDPAPVESAGPLLTSTPNKLHPSSSNSSQLSNIIEESSCSIVDDYTMQWQLTKVINFNGCGEKCGIKIHGLTIHDVLNAHYCFENKNQKDQNDWMLQYFTVHCPYGSNGEKEFKNAAFIIQGKTVCMKLWLEILSVSTSRFYRLRQDFLQFGGITSATKRQRSLSSKTLEAITWMEQYFQRVGDKRPDKADSIYLPTCLTEKKLFEIYVDDVYNGDLSSSISRSQFNNLFRKEFKHVSIPKQCRFSKCDFCTLIKIETVKPTTNKEEKENLRKLLDDHIKLQEQERQRYYANRRLATENPNECISLIADGMDQNKTNVPSLVRTPKSCQSLWTLRTHLTGVLVHGSGSHCYFDCLQWPHDCNLTLTCILNTLSELSKHRTLPPKLLLQMDNCVRENKNKYVYGFLLLMVELNIFTEIELGFLMVGHTHEDVDQSFSLLSKYLHKHSAESMEEMMKATRASNQNVTNASLVKYIFNIREWISPHLDKIKYHTEPHIFLFKKNRSGKATMFYKQWSHCNWEPDNNGCLLLKSVPTGHPNLVAPSLDKQDVPRLQKDLKKYEAAGIFSEQAKNDWELFMPQLEAYGSLPKENPPWILDEIATVEMRCAGSSREVVVPEQIMKHVQSSKEFRKIVIGEKKKSSSANRDSTLSKKARTENAASVDKPAVGCYVTMKCQKYQQWIPQIGLVESIDDSKVTIDWLEGTFTSTWNFWKYKGKPVREIFPRRAVIKTIKFTAGMRLRKCDANLIKDDYLDVEYV